MVISLVEVLPIANDDSVVSSEDEAFYIDALINDWDPNNSVLTIEFTNGVQPIITSMGFSKDFKYKFTTIPFE